MKVNYNELSKRYDNVRSADLKLLKLLIEEMEIGNETHILDFGCGTGNYANLIQQVTKAKVFGVEPSKGMRDKAISKNINVQVFEGNHEVIPFVDNTFDYIYLTDVIHHIPEINVMFKEFRRVLKSNGKICVATESHEQIDKRFYVKYFPATAVADKNRYPDICDIQSAAKRNNLFHIKTVVHDDNREVKVGKEFIKLVEQKGYSMFHLINEEEYQKGLERLKCDVRDKELKLNTSGGTMVWFQKV